MLARTAKSPAYGSLRFSGLVARVKGKASLNRQGGHCFEREFGLLPARPNQRFHASKLGDDNDKLNHCLRLGMTTRLSLLFGSLCHTPGS